MFLFFCAMIQENVTTLDVIQKVSTLLINNRYCMRLKIEIRRSFLAIGSVTSILTLCILRQTRFYKMHTLHLRNA